MTGAGAGPTDLPQPRGTTAAMAGPTHPHPLQQWGRCGGRTDLHHNLGDDSSGGGTGRPTTIPGTMAVGAGPVDPPQPWGQRQWGTYYQSGEGHSPWQRR
jgi:hypothetical protein